MSDYDLYLTTMRCPRCGETASIEVEIRDWQYVQNGEGYASCALCEKDFFVTLVLQDDTIARVVHDTSKKPYIPSTPHTATQSTDKQLQAFNTQYSEELALALGRSGDIRAVDALLLALQSTEQMTMPNYLEYSKEYRHLTPQERKDLGDRKLAFSLNWLKRLKLAEALGEARDKRAIPTLQSLLADTLELDFWGLGVGISVAEVAQSAIEKIEGSGGRE